MRRSPLLLLAPLLLTLSNPASPQTCASRVANQEPKFRGTPEVVIPTQGLPPDIQAGLTHAAKQWTNACPEKENIPSFTTNPNAPPPGNDPYDVARLINVAVHDEPPPFKNGGFAVAEFRHQANVLDIYSLCPDPQQNQEVAFCKRAKDPQTVKVIDWTDPRGQDILTHELGHTLKLNHDTQCSTSSKKSIMDARPEGGVILKAHCDLADALQCDPMDPPQSGCPRPADIFTLAIQVSGLSPTDGLGDLQWFNFKPGFSTSGLEGIDGNGSFSFSQNGDFTAGTVLQNRGVSFTASLQNTNKECTVTPISVEDISRDLNIQVNCACTSNCLLLGTDLICTTDECPMVFPDRSKFKPFMPIWPIFGPPWYTDRWGPPIDTYGAFCERQTICTEGTVEVTGSDGQIIVTDFLDCTDTCIRSPSKIILAGPSSAVSVTDISPAGELQFEGFAVDRQKVSMYRIYIDGIAYYPSLWSREIYRDDACGHAWGQNGVNCDPNAGFRGTLNVKNLAPGEHTLQVIALDNHPSYRMASLAETTFEIPICSDSLKPSVSIVAPASDSSLSNTVQVTAAASDNIEVQRVEFFVDGVRRHIDYTSPFTFFWATEGETEGEHLLNARAWDTCGNSKWALTPTRVSVDNHPECDGSGYLELCFGDGRYSVDALIDGERATALHWSKNGGFFTLDEPDGAEIAIKYLDGRSVNGHHWFFHGALTPLPYSITITDSKNGRRQTLLKPANSLCGGADTITFSDDFWIFGDLAAMGGCIPTTTAVCLMNHRFKVQVKKGLDFQRGYGVTDKTSSFGFGIPSAPKVVVKLYDGRWVNGHYWLFFGSLTTEPYSVRVTDTLTGADKFYASPGELCGSADGAAF